jgi:ArsR family transcriptional regulator
MFISQSPTQPVLPATHVVTLLRAAGEPTRIRILALLSRGELSVGELAQALNQSQPRISRHLRLLSLSNLVQRRPEGAWVFYRLANLPAPERVVMEPVLATLSHDDALLARDWERLGAIHAARAAAAARYFEDNAEDWDRLRALHLPDHDIDAAILDAAGEGPFDLLIDVGAGQGRMLHLFEDRCRRLEGFDLSRQMLAIARASLTSNMESRVGLRLGDVYDPPAELFGADIVTVHQVLHFLQDPGRAITHAVRLLRPGGRLIIVDFAPHDLEFLREAHAHRRLGFDDSEIVHWCAEAGLIDVETSTLAPSAQKTETLTVKIWSGLRLSLEDQNT